MTACKGFSISLWNNIITHKVRYEFSNIQVYCLKKTFRHIPMLNLTCQHNIMFFIGFIYLFIWKNFKQSNNVFTMLNILISWRMVQLFNVWKSTKNCILLNKISNFIILCFYFLKALQRKVEIYKKNILKS